MTFEFKYWRPLGNHNVRDITNKVVVDSLVIARRCDEAFATGRCQFIDDAVNSEHNLPPFTLCQIDGVKYFMQSESTLYQTKSTSSNEYYVHDCTIIELTAVLECFIVGTKVLSSNENDRAKMQILCELMSVKYGITFTLDTTNLSTSKNEYRFANGTTMYEALTQMAMRVNCRPVVTDYTYTDNSKAVTIGFIHLSSADTYIIQRNQLLQWTKTQSQDNYCKYLETEANNVIDTTNLTYDRNLTQRCIGEARLTYDAESGNGKIYTTARINRVNALYIKTQTYPVFNDMAGYDYFNSFAQIVDQGSYQDIYYPTIVGTTKSLWQLVANNQELYDFIKDWCELVGANVAEVMEKTFNISYGSTYNFTLNGTTYTDRYILMTPSTAFNVVSIPLEMTDYILEKNQYMAEAETVRSQYCYYEQGSNVIDGLHKKPSNNIWQAIAAFFTDSWNGDFVSKARSILTEDSGDLKSISHTGSITRVVATISSTLTIPNSAALDVEYEAITNPILLDTKTDNPANETSYKNFSRSYGVSASQIDFDKLVDSMSLSNEMLGRIEHTIEIMIDDSAPALTNLIKFNNNSLNGLTLGYLLNYEINYHVGYKSMTLYITKSIQNIANAIGIPYQYHATRLPIDNIVERPIRSKITMSTANKTAIVNNAGILLVQFMFKDANNSITKIVSRASILAKGDKVFVYCEAEDQYAWGYKADVESLTVTINTPIRYGDSNNEIVSFSCKFGFFDLTTEQSNDLPKSDLFSDNAFILTGVSNQKIYKDAYEKLTFTIEIE